MMALLYADNPVRARRLVQYIYLMSTAHEMTSCDPRSREADIVFRAAYAALDEKMAIMGGLKSP